MIETPLRRRRNLRTVTAMAACCIQVLIARAAAGEMTPPRSIDGDAYAGSVSCRACHERFYTLWATSHHGLAMQPYTAAFARQNLTPQVEEIVVGKRRYRAGVSAGEGWVLERSGEIETRLPIAHVMGGKHVYYFLTPHTGGRLQTLPVAYDVVRKQWFDTAGSGVRHFPDRSDAPLHWTARAYTFNTSCYACHVSQLSTNYAPATDTYRTTWAEPGINCETCHGPAADHVRVCREAEGGPPPADLKIIGTSAFSAEQTNTMCGNCHAKMNAITATYLPGERFFDHYDLATLEHIDYHPDGRDLGENYTYTSWRMSPCVQAGGLTCLHCHTSSGRYRFTGEKANGACLPCHAERVDNVAAHSHHAAGGAGSACVDCHMPMTEFARMKRSDHSMRPPTPAATMAFDAPNACNGCHGDKDAAWADRQVRTWHERDYQAPVIERSRLIRAARQGDFTELDAMLAYLRQPQREEMTAAGLLRLLRSSSDPRRIPAFAALLKDASPLVRARAAEALGDVLSPETLPALLEATKDEYRLVRVRAAASLARIPESGLEPSLHAALKQATAEYEASLRVHADDPTAHYNLGNFHADRGAYDEAIRAYETAIRLQPEDIAPLVNASLVHNAQGRNDRAEQALRRALAVEPNDPAACLNLALLLAEMGRRDEAVDAFRKTLSADPSSAAAAYNLAVLLAEKEPAEAVRWCKEACRLRPKDVRYAYTLAYYQHQAGMDDDAAATLSRLLDRAPDCVDAYVLLGRVHEEQGKPELAGAVYERATQAAALPEQVRAYFAGRAAALQQAAVQNPPAGP